MKMLLCPICQTELRRTEKQMKCENGHSFDLARQGYVNLMINGKKSSGDDRDMVKSRHLFLEEGFYAPLRDHVSNLIASRKPQVLVDAGCGEGYYTKVCAQHAREAYGF
ncbi:putative RNA methyltransferase, partial [Massilicoli timonensis]